MPEPDPFPSIKTPWGSATPPSGAGPGAGMRDLPPIPVPDHTLIRRVGKGSYGEVWLARNVLGVHRAVKIIDRRAFDDDRPFEREFAGIQRFEPVSRTHESQLNILHVGRGPDCFYYVMELADDMGDAYASGGTSSASPQSIPPLGGTSSASPQPSPQPQMGTPGTRPSDTSGGSLNPDTYTPRTLRSELLLRGRLPVDECIRLGLALTTALGHLHRHGLVHRDIKPSNIVFVKGIPKLADIGLVARAEATMSFVGTEGYLPPEGPGTVQADVFSLGKVLYEISTGRDRQQFPELPTGITELPDRAALAEFNEVILRACAPDAKQRYESAAEMHADLALLQSGKSVARMRAVERRLKFVVRAAAVVAGLAVVAGAAFFYQQVQTREARRLSGENLALAEAKTRLADENSKLAEDNRRRLVRLNIANGNRLLDEGDPSAALLWFSEALPLAAHTPPDESIHRIRIQQTLNEIPRVLNVLPHENEVSSSAFSKDGRRIVTGTKGGYLRVWDAHSGAPLWQPLALGVRQIPQVQFTRDGHRVFASSLHPVGRYEEPTSTNVTAIFDAETGRKVFSLSGTNLVRAGISPDDRWLVTADTGYGIHVLDARDGRPIAEFKGHTNRIGRFYFSPNGDVLASISEDLMVRLWRLPSGEPLDSPIPFEHGPITFSQDGRLLAMARTSSDGETNSTIHTWDVATGASVGSPIEMRGAIMGLGFVSQGKQDLFVTTDKQCALFDPESHQQVLQSIKTPLNSYIFSASPDGRRVAFAGPEGLAGVWSFETGELLLPPWLRDRPLIDVNFSPDGSQLLATSSDGTATLLSAHLSREAASYRFDAAITEGPPKPLLEWHRFSPDRRHFLLILKDETVRRVDFEQMTDRRIPADQFKGLRPVQVTFDASGRRGAITYYGAGTNFVEIWSEVGVTTNRFVFPHPVGLNAKLLFTPDGSRLVTPGEDGHVRFWRTSDGTLERSVQLQAIGQSLLFPDGHTALAVSSATKRFALFDLATGSRTGTILPTFEITAEIFNSSGDRFASAGNVNWSRVWSARTGEPLTPPLHHGGEVRWVDWSPEGKRIITAGLTPELKVWDSSTGEQLLDPLHLGTKPLETGLWSLDGRFIVARSDDNLVRVWDAATGEPVTPILKHNSYVRLARLVANNRLITLSLPNLMRAWDLTETRLPADVIADYAKLVSGGRFNAAGVRVPATPSELANLCRSLRARAPQLFE